MNALYNTGIRLYSLAARLVASRNPKADKMIRGQRETLPRLREALVPGRKYIWVHTASLGEFEQGRPVIERLRRDYPDYGIVLTFFSPSGYEVRKNYQGADVVCYLPFDLPGRVRDFLDTVNPAMAIFVKYEFWGNYLHALQRRGIPTYLISSIFRPSQPFFKKWGAMFRGMLKCYDYIFVQDADSLAMLRSIGVENAMVAGDTRFDRVTDIRRAAAPLPSVEEAFKEPAFTFVAGSSWPQDEAVYLDWLRRHPEVRTIIAPHEFDAARLEKLRSELGAGAVLLSELDARFEKDDVPADVRHIIVDCFGKLSSLYRYATVAYVGGGFGAGLHNINEAAVYGVPVVYGPNHTKFKEARDMAALGGGIPVGSRAEFEKEMDTLMADESLRRSRGEKAAAYIASQIGATDRIFNVVFGSGQSPRT